MASLSAVLLVLVKLTDSVLDVPWLTSAQELVATLSRAISKSALLPSKVTVTVILARGHTVTLYQSAFVVQTMAV